MTVCAYQRVSILHCDCQADFAHHRQVNDIVADIGSFRRGYVQFGSQLFVGRQFFQFA